MEKFYKFAFSNNVCNDISKFQNNCEYMYKTKTYDRIKQFKNTNLDKLDYINGVFVESISIIINKIDWNKIIFIKSILNN